MARADLQSTAVHYVPVTWVTVENLRRRVTFDVIAQSGTRVENFQPLQYACGCTCNTRPMASEQLTLAGGGARVKIYINPLFKTSLAPNRHNAPAPHLLQPGIAGRYKGIRNRYNISGGFHYSPRCPSAHTS